MFIVIADGKGYGLFGSEEVARQWALSEFPVASAQGYVEVRPFEFVTVEGVSYDATGRVVGDVTE